MRDFSAWEAKHPSLTRGLIVLISIAVIGGVKSYFTTKIPLPDVDCFDAAWESKDGEKHRDNVVRVHHPNFIRIGSTNKSVSDEDGVVYDCETIYLVS